MKHWLIAPCLLMFAGALARAEEWPSIEQWKWTPCSEMSEAQKMEFERAVEAQRAFLYDRPLQKPATAFAECQIDASRPIEAVLIPSKAAAKARRDRTPEQMGVSVKPSGGAGLLLRIDATPVPADAYWDLKTRLLSLKEPGKGAALLDMLIDMQEQGIIKLGKAVEVQGTQAFKQDVNFSSWISLARPMQNDFSTEAKPGLFSSPVRIRVRCRYPAGE